MASKKPTGIEKPAWVKKHMRTSIGQSVNSRPKNKNKRRNFKRYRGQGK
jgi:hypothetical protein